MDAQHTRESASSNQNSLQESPRRIFFVSKVPNFAKSPYALRIPTLQSSRWPFQFCKSAPKYECFRKIIFAIFLSISVTDSVWTVGFVLSADTQKEVSYSVKCESRCTRVMTGSWSLIFWESSEFLRFISESWPCADTPFDEV